MLKKDAIKDRLAETAERQRDGHWKVNQNVRERYNQRKALQGP